MTIIVSEGDRERAGRNGVIATHQEPKQFGLGLAIDKESKLSARRLTFEYLQRSNYRKTQIFFSNESPLMLELESQGQCEAS